MQNYPHKHTENKHFTKAHTIQASRRNEKTQLHTQTQAIHTALLGLHLEFWTARHIYTKNTIRNHKSYFITADKATPTYKLRIFGVPVYVFITICMRVEKHKAAQRNHVNKYIHIQLKSCFGAKSWLHDFKRTAGTGARLARNTKLLFIHIRRLTCLLWHYFAVLSLILLQCYITNLLQDRDMTDSETVSNLILLLIPTYQHNFLTSPHLLSYFANFQKINGENRMVW